MSGRLDTRHGAHPSDQRGGVQVMASPHWLSRARALELAAPSRLACRSAPPLSHGEDEGSSHVGPPTVGSTASAAAVRNPQGGCHEGVEVSTVTAGGT